MRAFGLLFAALAVTLGVFARTGVALAPALFVVSALSPALGLAGWLGPGASGERPGRGVLAVVAAILSPVLALAIGWGGSGVGGIEAREAAALSLLLGGLMTLAIAAVELLAAAGISRVAACAAWCGAHALCIASPFFLPGWLAGPIAGFHEADVAAAVVRVHPFAAACDAGGGLDGFRDDVLYARAQIGARHAYRYPSSAVYTSLCYGGALVLAAAALAAAWLRRRLAPPPRGAAAAFLPPRTDPSSE